MFSLRRDARLKKIRTRKISSAKNRAVADEQSHRDRHPEGLASICAMLNVDKTPARPDRETHDAGSFQRSRRD
jgi:hypothetical protein